MEIVEGRKLRWTVQLDHALLGVFAESPSLVPGQFKTVQGEHGRLTRVATEMFFIHAQKRKVSTSGNCD